MLYLVLVVMVVVVVLVVVARSDLGLKKLTEFGRKCIFNDTLNTFYLWLYGVGHVVKDHSDSERGNPLLPHGYSFRLASSHIQDNTYHSLCYTSRGALDGTRTSPVTNDIHLNAKTI